MPMPPVALRAKMKVSGGSVRSASHRNTRESAAEAKTHSSVWPET